MFIFQSKFNNPPYRDRITEKSWTSKKINGTYKFQKQEDWTSWIWKLMEALNTFILTSHLFRAQIGPIQ